MSRTHINQEFVISKVNADAMVNLVNYLKIKNITEDLLEDDNILMAILCEGMKKFPTKPPTSLHLQTLKETILLFKIDYLKVTHLYRLNIGVLAVACVEHLMYPDRDGTEYAKIYHCYRPAHGISLYKKLCGISEEDQVDEAIAKSAAWFFNCETLLNGDECLDTIRSYLKEIDIDDSEKLYIQNASIKSINNKAIGIVQAPANIDPIEDNLPTSIVVTESPPPTPRREINPFHRCITRQFIRKKINSDKIINFVDYLKKNEIEYEHLENDDTLLNVLREGMKMYRTYRPREVELDEFKKTIRYFTTDYLKTVNLYRLNRGVLLVACVEYLMYPNEDNEKYLKIYNCNNDTVIEHYNKLCDFPDLYTPPDSIVSSARTFFYSKRFTSDNNGCLETIRSYLKKLVIDAEELNCIRHASIQLIYFDEAAFSK